jgi:hypothetical protein
LRHNHSQSGARNSAFLENNELRQELRYGLNRHQSAPECSHNVTWIFLTGCDQITTVPKSLKENAEGIELHEPYLSGAKVSLSFVEASCASDSPRIPLKLKRLAIETLDGLDVLYCARDVFECLLELIGLFVRSLGKWRGEETLDQVYKGYRAGGV